MLWPNDRNISIQYNVTLLGAIYYMLRAFYHMLQQRCDS